MPLQSRTNLRVVTDPQSAIGWKPGRPFSRLEDGSGLVAGIGASYQSGEESVRRQDADALLDEVASLRERNLVERGNG